MRLTFWCDPLDVRNAFESVSTHADPDWTLLILDEGYPDLAPWECVQGLGDERITYVRNAEDLGPSRNHSKGVGRVDVVRDTAKIIEPLPGRGTAVKGTVSSARVLQGRTCGLLVRHVDRVEPCPLTPASS